MKILIKRISTITTLDDIDPDDTIYAIKQKIQEKTGIPVHQQVFVFAGKQLDNKNTLYDYAVKSGDTITLVVQNISQDKTT
jgi:hypothetical protein